MSDPEALPGENSDIELPLSVKLESMLFVAPEPVTTAQLATALDVAPSVVERGLNELDAALATRGLRLQRHAGRFQLTTAPQLAELIERFLGLESTTHLSRAALETLAIIAYRQPITRADVEAVRGVAVEGVLQSLMERGLVKIAGRAEVPGRPLLYETTQFFLDHFGLRNLDELPNAEELRTRYLPTAPPAAPTHSEPPAAPEQPVTERAPLL